MLGKEKIKRAAENYPWWTLVRDTAPMGPHGGVFDYKWLGVTMDGKRAHAIAMLLWDRLALLALFHDPSCACGECQK
jgi:hypothetical protein